MTATQTSPSVPSSTTGSGPALAALDVGQGIPFAACSESDGTFETIERLRRDGGLFGSAS